ncbi:thrombopoietin-like isoform X3 [Labrus bergylta]|uniref:thrombopoietin-like isoform X3 n=1 Tax=Labrus bergylta TaxID=56723 RepID=UPI003313D79B
MSSLQSCPLCAPPGFLLLLIGVISSHLPGVQSRPVDFWCNRDARKNLVKTIEELKKDMLPPVWVQPAEWANKTFQQKRAEVLGALRVLQDGVQRATSQTTLQCQASLLERLGHHVTNYVGLVSSLQIQADRETSSHPEVPNSPPQTSLTKVLERYRNLLKGKLERLAVDLKDSLCHAEHRTDDS